MRQALRELRQTTVAVTRRHPAVWTLLFGAALFAMPVTYQWATRGGHAWQFVVFFAVLAVLLALLSALLSASRR